MSQPSSGPVFSAAVPGTGGLPRVIPIHTPALFEAAVREAVALLKDGQLVALPTETVYGLAANALDRGAVARIFEAKGRPSTNPIIVHVAGREQARACSSAWPRLADQLADSFWPGPLTLVVPKAAVVPDLVSAGGPTVAVRWPSHPFMQAVIKGCGFPLAAPSANRSNGTSPTQVDHVVRSLRDRVPLVVDGGSCNVGIESTVVDVTGSVPRVLRPGMIHLEEILGATLSPGRVDSHALESGDAGILRSPGLLDRHYAPRAEVRVLAWRDDADLRHQLEAVGCPIERIHLVVHERVPSGFPHVMVIPQDPAAYARALYAQLHRCDEDGAQLIVFEPVPAGPAWDGVRDRLARASWKGTTPNA